MKTIELLKDRRSIYGLNKNIEVSKDKIVDLVEKSTELVPDAFNMKSSRVVVVTEEKQNELWEIISDAFGGKVPREKIEMFKNAYGTILYFYENEVVKGLQNQFPSYADNFPKWAEHSSAMLQLSIWNGLTELGLGANLQHYNPVIDSAVKEFLGLPESYILVAQMPFGNVLQRPDAKEKEEISNRVKFF